MTLRLVVDGRDVGPVEVASSRAARRRGLLGRDGFGPDGPVAMVLVPCRSVHTVGMRFGLDVAHLRSVEGGYVVVRTRAMPKRRIDRPVWRSKAVLEAAGGAFAAWGLGVGSRVELLSGGVG